MAAYNLINFKTLCPACNKVSELISQTHIASDFGGKDERYCMKGYKIGERMNWWDVEDLNYKDWRQGNLIENNGQTKYDTVECCYTECKNCKAELYAIIEFEDLTPINIKEVGLKDKYPKNYYK